MTIALQVDDVIRALSDPTRRAVFEEIARSSEVSVSHLTRVSGVTQGAVSQHLAKLKQAGLVASKADGRQVFYSVQPEGLKPLSDWLGHYQGFWRERFDGLRDLLEGIEE
ncbi:ArsR/SmtB family transcription factor [Sphingobium sp. B2D3C]|uniref:ArsR/SmtB family transcription factor n=1 Tax=Sphingobium sp. B2D3C TaxID=2940581 RepID=UPI0022250CA4|nr:metalloregulator ArsR/SmtB family transcription factor [Sphingobium sp. B2D3C]MCW2397895.1 DNA-binding transcriptional ArsR family regulator [Sphingobium sp. B2D3C]